MLLGSPRVSTSDMTSVRSAVYAQRSRMTDRRPRYGIVDRNSPHPFSVWRYVLTISPPVQFQGHMVKVTAAKKDNLTAI